MMTRKSFVKLGCCLVTLLTFTSIIAQDNPAGLQGDDVEIYANAGAHVSLQGDDFEIHIHDSTLDSHPLSRFQGDDTEIFTSSIETNTLQGDDSEIYASVMQVSDQLNSTITETHNSALDSNINLITTLAPANPDAFNHLPSLAGAALPDMRSNDWQQVDMDNRVLVIGGFAVIILLVAGGGLLLSGASSTEHSI